MALNNIGVGIVFTATDLASSVVSGMAGKFISLDDTVAKVSASIASKFGMSVKAMTASLKTLTIGLAAAGLGFIGLTTAFSLAAPAGEFEQGLAAVGAVTRATAEQMRSLELAAINAGVATQFSPTEAVEGLKSLATAGQTARQATATLIPVLDLAAGSMGQLGVAGAADAVVGTLNSYQMSAEEAVVVTDKLLRTTQLTNFQARDFAVGLSKAAAAGAQFGQTLDDTLITVGLMRNANVDASSSSTAFREATRRLASDLRAQKAVTDQGVDVFDRLTGKMRALPDIMIELAENTKSMTDQERNRAVVMGFGARGLLAFNAIAKAQATVMRDGREVVLRGAEAIAHLRKQLSDAGGTAAEFRDKLLDTFEGQKTLLEGTLQTIAIAIGKPFAKVLKPIVAGVVETLNFMLRLFLKIPEPIKNAFAAFFVAASVTLLVGGLALAIKALIPLLVAAAGAAFALLLPFLKIIAVVGLVVGAVILLKKVFDSNFGGIRDAVLPVLETISLAFRSLWALFSSGEISGALAEDLLRAENAGVFRFVQAVSRAVAFVQQIVTGIFRGIVPVFKRIFAAFEPVVARTIKIFGHLFSIVGSMISTFAELFGFEFLNDGTTNIDAIAKSVELLLEPIVIAIELFALLLEGVLAVIQAITALGDSKIVGGVTQALFGATTGNHALMTAGVAKIGASFTGSEPSSQTAVKPVPVSATPTASRGSARAPGAFSTPSAPLPTGRAQDGTRGAAGGVSGAQIAGLLTALEQRLGQPVTGQPVVVQGVVELDGRAVGAMRASEEADNRSRAGAFRPAFGG